MRGLACEIALRRRGDSWYDSLIPVRRIWPTRGQRNWNDLRASFWDTTGPKLANLPTLPEGCSLGRLELTNGNQARMSSIGWGTGFISGNILPKERVDG